MQLTNHQSPITNHSAPTTTIFGYLNLVFGLMGIACGLMGSLPLWLASTDSAEPLSVLRRQQPYLGWTLVAMVVGPLLSAVLIAAGIGLLRHKRWGTSLSLVWAIAAIPIAVVKTAINVLYLAVPLLDELKHTTDPEISRQMFRTVKFSLVGSIDVVYPVVLLYYMMRRRGPPAIRDDR